MSYFNSVIILGVLCFLLIVLLVVVRRLSKSIISLEKHQKNDLDGIKDSIKKVEKPDMLKSLFKMQKDLQRNFYNKGLPNDEPEIMGRQILNLFAELGEVMQEDKRWKTWRKNVDKIDTNRKKEEIADCWHFLINISLYSGMDAEDLYGFFTKKNKENIKRCGIKEGIK